MLCVLPRNVKIALQHLANLFACCPKYSLGFIIGLVLCSVVMSVIASSVNAAIVLFADAPAEFEQNYPKLSSEMRQAYQVAHPGSI
jgi:hypothetical protein